MGVVDALQVLACRTGIRSHREMFGGAADEGARVIGVVDGEVWRQSGESCVTTQPSRAGAVEGRDGRLTRGRPAEIFDPFTHFRGSAVGEGHGQYLIAGGEL